MAGAAGERSFGDLLESFSLTREDVVEVVRAALEEADFERHAPITAHERSILTHDSGLGEEGMRVLRFRRGRGPGAFAVETGTRERTHMVRESVSMEEAAELLGRSVSALSRAASQERLVVFRLDGRVRYPLWQFHDGKPLPGLAQLVPALPDGWRPRKVLAVMTAPSESLDGLSPVQWLAETGQPEQVVELIEDLERE